MERRALIERWSIRIVVSLVLLGAIIGGAIVATRKPVPAGRPRAVALGPSDARAPQGVRIRVEVLNASHVFGLARRATFFLRDRGFDVVEAGNAGGSRRDTSLVLARSGHVDWATLVAKAMGGAPMLARPDTSHDVDVTVLVGASWRPPAEPFYP
ncbi:MAG TPA: LytR C-terminal domain-containing protein [Gemmatimonadaceae bacterium]|nr:LytR C-terminal domain-containing protein [Gemmatimonadaceae bacterium]